MASESDSLDNAAWSEHDTSLFPLVESELDNYWNHFDPFEGAAAVDLEERPQVMSTPPDWQATVKRQMSLPSPPLQQQQRLMSSPSRKRPRVGGTATMLLECCGDEAEQTLVDGCRSSSSFDVERQQRTTPVTYSDGAIRRPSPHQPSSYDILDVAADVATSSAASSLGIPLGLLSSLPPNCSVYITHRPASTSDQASPPPVTQIIINHARPSPSSTLPPSNAPHHPPLPCCMPPPPPLPLHQAALTTVSQFHPLDDVRLREPAASVSACRNDYEPLRTVARPPKSLSTYAAEFGGFGVGFGDVSSWKCERERRASDSATAAATSALSFNGNAHPDFVDRCRRHSSTFLPTSPAAVGATNSLMRASATRSSVNNFQRPTSLPLSPSVALTSVFQQQQRRELSCRDAAAPLPVSGWQHANAKRVLQLQRTPTTSRYPAPRTPGDEADGSLIGEVRLEDMTADSIRSDGDSVADGSSCLRGDGLQHFCSSSSSSPSSLVDGVDNHAELPSPALSTTSSAASTKPRQCTIDALSKKIQRNQTKKTVKHATIVGKDAQASSFMKPDSSCSTPLRRQLTPSPSSSFASFAPSDVSDVSRHHEVLLKNERADVGVSNNKGDLPTIKDANRSTVANDSTPPSRRKRIARRKSQTSRQLSANGIEKVIIAGRFRPTCNCYLRSGVCKYYNQVR